MHSENEHEHEHEHHHCDDYDCECDCSKDENNECQPEDSCIRWIEKNISINAAVSVTPHVELYEPEVHCCGPATLHRKKVRTSDVCQAEAEPCTFFVEQLLHVRIPLKFGADVSSDTLGIICDPDKKKKRKKGHNRCECDDDCDC